ncbi:hypothetical protein [Hyphomicrobium facile]|uniref:Uncharacterized protein n=1 Tax=Hyphomicrobium facile TaxID=51670 RepID=A0A1I7NQC6_9HYPH|nr:hypothetical protein [Hyphomicrobium facile]SFV36876.1 hypothetical protein SAMN04488557_2861 [Hyphomicrobium facile]
MQSPIDPRSRRDSIDPTEARQASPRKTNFRVLLASMALAVVVGAVLVAGFWQTTPQGMDTSSGGKLSEPSATSQTAPAGPSAAPSSEPSGAASPQANPRAEQAPSNP